jgi:DNA-binding NarL/FixJ family response regulator
VRTGDLIADDQPVMRAGSKAVLKANGDIEVAAEASNGEEAVSAAGPWNHATRGLRGR